MNKKTILALVLVFIGGLALGTSYNSLFSLKHEGQRLTANVYMFVETFQGSEWVDVGNVIVDIGENYVANIIGFNNVTAHNSTKWIATGNSTISQTKTRLDTEATDSGFERAEATPSDKWTLSGDIAINYTKKFTSTATITINAVSLCYSGTGNTETAFAIASIGSWTFPTGSNATFVWTIVYNAN